jgi:hypothetical protein
MEKIIMNEQTQDLIRFQYLVGAMQLPKVEYTVKRYRKGWFRGYAYSIESDYCKLSNIASFSEAMNMLMAGGIRVLDINVDRSCYEQ